MSRFKKGDIARLNFRKSKAGRYGENGRIADCVKYLGDSMWQVKARDTGKLRRWFTADMDNITPERKALATISELADNAVGV